MPVYIHLANLILDKKAVERKYSGGLEHFRNDYDIDKDGPNTEDHEVFSLTKMNPDEFAIEALVEKGMDFDFDNGVSKDFVILTRYSGCLWEVDWIRSNQVYAWHKEACLKAILKSNILAYGPMDNLIEMYEKGDNPFGVIL